MGQQSGDSPAQPLMDLYKKWTGKGKPPEPQKPPPDTSWHDDQVKKANDSFAKKAAEPPPADTKPAPAPAPKGKAAKIPSYKKGGKIRRTGLAMVHKGERMIPKTKVAKVEKAMHAMKRG
jgi:hypothetical protein